MSQRAERHAWHRFREVMASRQMEFDARVPVALLVLGVCPGGDDCEPETDPEAVKVHLDSAIAVLRPPGMDPLAVADLFQRAADELRRGVIK